MSTGKKNWNLKKRLLLAVTSTILLFGCNSPVIPELISTDKEIVLSVTPSKDWAMAKGLIESITTDHLLIITGIRRMVKAGKTVELPAGTAVGLYTGKFNIFYLRDFVEANHEQFPILTTKPVQDSVLAQEAWAKKYKVNLRISNVQ